MPETAEQAMADVKNTTQKLIARQEDLAAHLAMCLRDSQQIENPPKGWLDEQLVELNSTWTTFKANHFKILEDPNASACRYIKEGWCEQFRIKYSNATSIVYRYLESRATPVGNSTPQPSSNQTPLPRIHLPKFSGACTEWESFRDLFTSVVHNNHTLSNVQRLHYLRTCLEGEALALIDGSPITDEEYSGAWTELRERYENKRILMHNHLENLCNMPHIKRDSVADLKGLRDRVTKTVRSIKILGRKEMIGNDLCVYLTVQRFDPALRKDWEKSMGTKTTPSSFEDLVNFMDSNIRALETTGAGFHSQTVAGPSVASRARSTSTRVHHATSFKPRPCPSCKEQHYIGYCPAFTKSSLEQRKKTVSQLKLCTNCLSQNHTLADCTSNRTCLHCHRRHHSLLHSEASHAFRQASTGTTKAQDVHQSDSQLTERGSATSPVYSHFSEQVTKQTSILLATAMVTLHSPTGRSIRVRALLDQGSEASFVSETAVQLLRLPRQRIDIPIFGLGATQTACAKSSVHVELRAANSDLQYKLQLRAFVLPRLTSAGASKIQQVTTWTHIKGLTLADPTFSSSTRIDIILGADVYGSLLRDGVRQGTPEQPTAQRTALGWVLSGPVSSTETRSGATSTRQLSALHSYNDAETHHLLQRFWEIEETYTDPIQTEEEKECEAFFRSTHCRNKDGRYVVRLPFKLTPLPDLRSSKQIAMQQLMRFERRQSKEAATNETYAAFLQEYLLLGHMVAEPTHTSTVDQVINAYYMPHHAVIRQSSVTTKLRVVFNASQKTAFGISLNDCLHTGPILQRELPSLITQWRSHRFVFTADIEKMYRQILVHPDDSHLQRIVWRESNTQPINSYRLLTVTYGTACAPYLALRTLQQLAEDEKTNFPLGAEALRHDFYVDDALSGADDLDAAIERLTQLRNLLESGGFKLRKWVANHPQLIQHLPAEDRLQHSLRSLETDDQIRTLGLNWDPSEDCFQFIITPPTVNAHPTKRIILSYVARLFDPLGWLAPVIIVAKSLLQKLWLTRVNWDEELPADLAGEWLQYCQHLQCLSSISISRWTGQRSGQQSYELHGFSDASMLAYGAVAYLRVISDSGEIHTTLLQAKTKVAPLKQLSIPRLELCGAVLLARLLKAILTTIKLPDLAIYTWTDSKVVLCWLRDHPARWNCFVGNRVSEIQTLLPTAIWRHVPSADNPADHASRGLPASDLKQCTIWWQGPRWLKTAVSTWPRETVNDGEASAVQERRPCRSHHSSPNSEDELLFKFSSFLKLCRVTAYCRRFANNASRCPKDRVYTPLTPEEITTAKFFWINRTQRCFFHKEAEQLSTRQPPSKGSPLLRLRPFLDKSSTIRVGGRLQNSDLSYAERHPVILPKHSRLTALIIAAAHLSTLHGGAQLTLSYLLREFWILSGRSAVRTHIHKCVTCFKAKASSNYQMMGNLPKARITPARPFLRSGVDYAGPILLKTLKGRGGRSSKGYIALFVCLVTKAIHLEVVSDYTSDAFLAAYRRFTSRRGICSELWSDNGTNFRGSNKELRTMFKSAATHLKELSEAIANDGTSWHFIPPGAPHFGGIWEAGVKSVKHHLRRIIGERLLTYEEMSTLLTQIEACLNSRPLSPLSDNPEDLVALTPGHFLIGAPLTAIPEPTCADVPTNRLSRWRLLQNLHEHFWSRWRTEYLHHLQQRFKWQTPSPNLQKNDLVLLKDERLPPCKWLLGRVIDTHPGQDGLVRVVTVRTSSSTFKRPTTKVCPLPSPSTDSSGT